MFTCLLKPFEYILYWLSGDQDSLISEEGWAILRDPVKKVRLRKMIDNYHTTGIWNFKILEDDTKKI